MTRNHVLIAALVLLLTACTGTGRPTYSGHEESTEGVPGFVNGKKVSPHVKLGQSYTVDGETYVPRNQPDYVEEGLASWYGPGFHGGKTANGEVFDKYELTAAHRTLPLPSIVRVTLLSTGKQVVVRVNDRGPFARSRIIDLSRAAADKIGLVQAGVGKVRVEYMKPESERFAELLSQGRDPKSIDIASEVLNYQAPEKTQYARSDVRVSPKGSGWDHFNPVASAQAGEPEMAEAPAAAEDADENEDKEQPIADNSMAAPVGEVSSSDLSLNASSPFNAMADSKPVEQKMAILAPASTNPQPQKPAAPPREAYYVQLGAFLKVENAEHTRDQFAKIDKVEIIQKPNARGQMLYHVRMGPYASQREGGLSLNKVAKAGKADARIIHE